MTNLMRHFKQILKLSYYSAISELIDEPFLKFTPVHCCYIRQNVCELLEVLNVKNEIHQNRILPNFSIIVDDIECLFYISCPFRRVQSKRFIY
jgi:hypothetical protein